MTSEVSSSRPHCHFAWQITGRCNHACRYCLRRRIDKPTAELGAEDCRRILENFLAYVRRQGMVADFCFSGGNPLLRADLPALLDRVAAARVEGLAGRISFLANPETLDAAALDHLKAVGTSSFSVSLDGTREHNDAMRGAGAYDAAVRAIPELVACGIRVPVKFTLSRLNRFDLPGTVEQALSLGAESVGVGWMQTPDGAGDISDLVLTPAEYREFTVFTADYAAKLPESRRDLARILLRFGRGALALVADEEGRLDDFRRQDAELGLGRGRGPFGRPHNPGDTFFLLWEDGGVHPGNYWHPSPCVGYAQRDSFEDLAARLAALPQRRHAPFDASREPAAPVCRTCSVREFCHGDAPWCWRLAAAQK